MPAYFVEGLYVTPKGVKKARKTGHFSQADVEPFARSFWANTPAEALQLAAEALEGGEWVEEPRVSQTTEEKRMRQMGMPELPGFDLQSPKKKRRK